MEEYKLNTSWNLWTHLLNDTKWDISSYNCLFTISNLYDFIYLENNINKSHFDNYMIFIMRINIEPIWESKDNINGCTYSFKIPSKNIMKEWKSILFMCISESIHKDVENYKLLNGISIVPKKSFYIIKLWFSENINLSERIQESNPYFLEKLSMKKKHSR